MRDAVEPIVVQTSKKSTHKFERPRAIIWTRLRKLSLSARYDRMHSVTILRLTCRSLKRSFTKVGFVLAVSDAVPRVFTRFDPKRPAPARGAINHLMVTAPVRLTTLASNNTYNACEDASFQRSIGFEN